MQTFHHIVVGDIATNCWIYPLGKNGAGPADDSVSDDGITSCAVIDPGGEGDRIISLLDSLKLVPAYILLTHGHFDHIAAVPALAREYRNRRGVSCEIAVHAADSEYLGPGCSPVHYRSFSAASGESVSSAAAYIDRLWNDMPPPDRTLAEGDTVGPFTVLHLPGHSPGSMGLWDKDAGILFSGDTLFYNNYGRTDLLGGDEKQLFASLKRLFAMDGAIRVLAGHGPATTIGQEIAYNSGIWG